MACLPIGKNTALVHSSASALSTRGVFTGHGPSSKVSTTSLSVRKSSCLKCSKPKPVPPVVSISTTRLTPSASGVAHAVFGCDAAAGLRAAAGRAEIATATETTGDTGATSATKVGTNRSTCRAQTAAGAANTTREDVKNHKVT